jgi:Concanavalin A-like lectin/glucanases superfamily
VIAIGLTTGAILATPVTLCVTVNNIDYADPAKNPNRVGIPFKTIHISNDIRGNAQADFDIEDPSGLLGSLPMWTDVAIWDGYEALLTNDLQINGAHSPNGLPWINGFLFRGVLVSQEQRQGLGLGQTIHCVCVDYGILLDRTYLPAFNNGAVDPGGAGFYRANQGPTAMGLADFYGGIPAPLFWYTQAFQYGGEILGNIVGAGTTRALWDKIGSAAASFDTGGASVDYMMWVDPMGLVCVANVTPGSNLLRFYAGHEAFGWGGNTAFWASRYLITDDPLAGPDSYSQRVWDTPGLVGYWRLDEEGTANASSRKGLIHQISLTLSNAMPWKVVEEGTDVGTYVNTPVRGAQTGFLTGEPNTGCVALVAASTQYVTVPNSPRLALGDTITFECWVGRSTATAQGIVNLGAGSLQVVWNADGSISGQKAGTGDFMKSTTTLASDSALHHVVVVKRPGAAAVYIDGVSVGGAYTAQTLANSASPMELGRQQGGTNYLNGWLGLVAVYSVALSAQQVTDHYGSRAVKVGTTPGSGLVVTTDGTQSESRVYNPTTGLWTWSDTATGADRGAQSAYRALSSAALVNGQPASAYLGPKQTRVRGEVTIEGRDVVGLGQTIRITSASVGLAAAVYTVYQTDIQFLSATGQRRTTIGFGSLTAVGSRPSASRQLQARLSKGGF